MAGIYAAVFVKESTTFREWVAQHNFPQAQEDRQRLHVTVLHTSKDAHRVKELPCSSAVHVARPESYIILPHGDRRCLALQLKCETLEQRHKELLSLGLTHKYPEFIPHITISYDLGDYLNHHNLPPLPGPIILHKEVLGKASRRFFHDEEYWHRLQIHLSAFKRTMNHTTKQEENDRRILAA
jgi:hypothetical protein